MKKLTKIMLSFAAALTMTAAIAVTAMAEGVVETITGTYDNTTGTVTMNGVVGSGTSQTLLVLDSNEDIAYINQIDNITSDDQNFSTFKLAPGLKSSTPKTYNIKVGGKNGKVQYGTLTIAADAQTVTIVIGDIDFDGDGIVNMDDVTALQEYVTRIYNDENANVNHQYTVVSGLDGVESFTIGDIDFDGDGIVNMDDVTALQEFVTRIYNDENANVGTEVVSIPITSAD